MNHVMCLFAHWNCGSPSTASAMQKSVDMAVRAGRPQWAVQFAKNLFEDYLPFSRLPGGPSGSRGAANLLAAIEALRASDYNHLHVEDIDRLACSAQHVLPHRISGSMPEQAAIVKPENVLEEPYKSEFLAMPFTIPRTDKQPHCSRASQALPPC